jgi:hypothetical protein
MESQGIGRIPGGGRGIDKGTNERRGHQQGDKETTVRTKYLLLFPLLQGTVRRW